MSESSSFSSSSLRGRTERSQDSLCERQTRSMTPTRPWLSDLETGSSIGRTKRPLTIETYQLASPEQVSVDQEIKRVPQSPGVIERAAARDAFIVLFKKVCTATVVSCQECSAYLSSLLLSYIPQSMGGISYTPHSYETRQTLHATVSSPVFKISLAFLGLVGVPLLLYGCVPATTPAGLLQAIITFWDGFLFLSCRMVFVLSLIISFYYARTKDEEPICEGKHAKLSCYKRNSLTSRVVSYCLYSKAMRFHRMAFFVASFLIFLIGIIGPWTLVLPSWMWHPFLWGSYKVYWPSKLAPAMQGLCVDYSLDEGKNGRLPLCLTNDNWDTLSSGALTSTSTSDVESVLRGITYGKQQSGGIVISILARDVSEFIAPFRQNVESLVPFFSNVAVVIFENDSKDGSREAFKRWSQVVKGYEVDLIECDDAVDCKLGKVHRDDVGDFAHSSAIGDMHKYRQRVVDYVLEKPEYTSYSHMIVLDVDLGVSISPLGVLHTLGSLPDHPVASVGRQPWPTAFGTLVTPYDFSAFRPYATRENARLLELHKAFCDIMPPGDRWRNECDALSPIQMIQMLTHDRKSPDEEFIRVESAFNGAVMYPLKLVRDTNAKYNAGDDGQRCEHVGFHMSLQKTMYLNRKWDMHISPTIPGGPNGARAEKTAFRIFFSPTLQLLVDAIHIGAATIFVWSSMTIGAWFVYPLLIEKFKTKRRRRRRHSGAVKMV